MIQASAVLCLKEVSRVFRSAAGNRVEVLTSINLELERGELVALCAPSGVGKSTLLHIAGLLDRPTSGKVIIAGNDCTVARDRVLTRFRCAHIGFIYQAHHLMADFNAVENVILPQMLNGVSKRHAVERAKELLEEMNMADRFNHKPSELSGGEQQRVAVARALANQPAIILADEPTGNLDHETGSSIFDHLLRLAHKTRVAILVATHNLEFARLADRKLIIANGRLLEG